METSLIRHRKTQSLAYILIFSVPWALLTGCAGTKPAKKLSINQQGKLTDGVLTQMDGFGWLTGNVVDKEGNPIKKAMLKINVEKNLRFIATTDELGKYFILNLPPGRHQVRCAIYREPDKKKLKKEMELIQDIEDSREKMTRLRALSREQYESNFGEWTVQEVEIKPDVATQLRFVLEPVVWVPIKPKLER